MRAGAEIRPLVEPEEIEGHASSYGHGLNEATRRPGRPQSSSGRRLELTLQDALDQGKPAGLPGCCWVTYSGIVPGSPARIFQLNLNLYQASSSWNSRS